ncbi:MAG: HNH endonuclease [candidate division Zixibacteria bacterium]|nr:HNH endonuclease [candidate division Zixibacteria bacterium]
MINHEARAFKAWNILVGLAPHGRLITYEELAEQLETHARADRFVLELIQKYCMENILPPLTILVVNKQTNQPGAGFIAWNHDNLVEGRAGVRNHDWAKESNPFFFAADGTTSDELIERILVSPVTSAAVYARVKVRGVQQTIFRQALLRAYEGRCAFSGISFSETLDAAHIIPWSHCASDLRMNPRNGILMLCSHHRLFDLGLLSVDEEYRIVFNNKKSHTLGSADQSFVAALHGKQIALPSDEALWPDKELIRRRNDRLVSHSDMD